MSPALAGGFLTTVPPGEPMTLFLKTVSILLKAKVILAYLERQQIKSGTLSYLGTTLKWMILLTAISLGGTQEPLGIYSIN